MLRNSPWMRILLPIAIMVVIAGIALFLWGKFRRNMDTDVQSATHLEQPDNPIDTTHNSGTSNSELNTAVLLSVAALVGTVLTAGVLFWALVKTEKANSENATQLNQFISSAIADVRNDLRDLYLSKKESQDFVRYQNMEGVYNRIERLEKKMKSSPQTFGSHDRSQHQVSNRSFAFQEQSRNVGGGFQTADSELERASVLYARGPEPDGTFKASELSQEPEWDTLYVLRIDTRNQSKATIDIHSNPDRFRTAIQAPPQYLSPACEYATNPASSATGIAVVSRGSAVLDGSQWKIQEKLQIRFA